VILVFRVNKVFNFGHGEFTERLQVRDVTSGRIQF
jgi:hypothetical protein